MTATRRPRLEDFGTEYVLSFDDWKAEHFGFPRPLKPRRRALRQAEPQRLRGLSVDRRITLGEPSCPWWRDRSWRNVLALSLFAVGLWLSLGACGHFPEVFRP